MARRALIVAGITAFVIVVGIALAACDGDGSDGQAAKPSAAARLDETTVAERTKGSGATARPKDGSTASSPTAPGSNTPSSVDDLDGTPPGAEATANASSPSPSSAPGAGRSRPTPTRPRGGDAPGPDETAPPDIEAAYIGGYRDECREVWTHAGKDGLLWDAVYPEDFGPFTVDDCLDELFEAWASSYDNEADARAGGIEDANWEISTLIASDRLRNAAGFIYDLP